MAGHTGLDGLPGHGGAEPPAGPRGSLHGAAAWHWHRREGHMDARHTCPWCAPPDYGPPPARRRMRRDELDELIARIDRMIAGNGGARAADGWAQEPGWAWRRDPSAEERLNTYKG